MDERDPSPPASGASQELSGWPEVLTVQEAARLLQVPEQTVRTLARRGELPARKVGKGWRISLQALTHWLDSHRDGSLRPQVGERASASRPPEPPRSEG